MVNTESNIEIAIDLNHDNDSQLLNQYVRQLYQSITRIGVESIERAPNKKTVEGAKGLPVDANTLLVTLSSAGVIVALIQLLQAWVLRTEGRTVKIRVEGEAVEFEYNPGVTSENELMAFAGKLQKLLEK